VARSKRPAPIAPVTWRDGVHLTGTPIWCDARRRRDVCFVSSADRVGRAGHGQLIGTPITLALVARETGHLAVPVRRPFTLGTLRLELIPSGRGLGAAALHVDGGGRTVLYAGAIRTVNPAEAAEVRACEAVVVAAPFGEVKHEFPPVDEVAGRLVAWVRAQLAAGKTPVLVVDTVLDGIEVATRLVAEDLVVAGSRTLRDAALRIGSLAKIPAIRSPGKEPATTIRLETDRVKLADGAKAVTALVSGRALDSQSGWDAGFAWPFVAGRAQLLGWIEQSRAKDVFVTGACAEAIVDKLGPRARVLGPPHQMALFAP
jgi:putative mRNA 3-end processing factor